MSNGKARSSRVKCDCLRGFREHPLFSHVTQRSERKLHKLRLLRQYVSSLALFLTLTKSKLAEPKRTKTQASGAGGVNISCMGWGDIVLCVVSLTTVQLVAVDAVKL